MASFFKRLTARLTGAEKERYGEEAGMSPRERHYVDERVEDHQIDEFVEEHLGAIDPERLTEDDTPRSDA